MDEKTESLIERGASLLIGLVLLLVGLIANVSDRATTVLLAIGIPLISLATGIQLINALPHAVVDAKNYIKNSGQPPTPPKVLLENSTELPEWLKGYEKEYKNLEERLIKVDKQQMEIIEKEVEKEISVAEQTLTDVRAPISTPNLEDVVFPEKEPCVPCEELAKMVVVEDDQELPKEE